MKLKKIQKRNGITTICNKELQSGVDGTGRTKYSTLRTRKEKIKMHFKALAQTKSKMKIPFVLKFTELPHRPVRKSHANEVNRICTKEIVDRN